MESKSAARTRVRIGRIGNIKVRTGCLTCKSRHVKCDEVKPKCKRCSIALRQCSWPTSSKAIVRKRPQAPILLPKQLNQLSAIPASISNHLFGSDEESWYFKIYAERTHRELSGSFHSEFWSRIVLQAAQASPIIRHAVIAIGALALKVKSPTSHPTGLLDVQDSLSDHQFALTHYQTFLNGTRQALFQQAGNLRLALISCLLVTCIEDLQWHHHSALRTVRNGTELLNSWLQKQPMIANYALSPDSSTIEDGIIQQIKNYDMQTSWLCDSRSFAFHESLRYEGSCTIRSMPEHFNNLEEARSILDLIFRRVHHFIVSIRPGRYSPADTFSTRNMSSFNAILDNEASFDPLTLEQAADQYKYLQEIKRWSASFERLSRSTTTDSPHFIGVNLLRIRSSLLPILLFGQLTNSEMIYDQFLYNFTEIVACSRTHFAHPSVSNMKQKGIYSLNTGLTHPLYVTSIRCRDRKIRRDAIDILTRKPWREGVMVSFICGKIGEFLMEIEEEHVSTYSIPREARARILGIKYHEDGLKRRLGLSGVKPFGDRRQVVKEEWEWGAHEPPWVDVGMEDAQEFGEIQGVRLVMSSVEVAEDPGLGEIAR